ncbi:MAG: Clp1/GlmU family protein [Chthonomonadales bacterium]
MNIADYPEWAEHIIELSNAQGIVLIMGPVDAGKSTFTTLLANTAFSAGRSVAVVDSDVGQSDIGPPGCVGLGKLTGEIRTLGDLEVDALAFVGSTSPNGVMIELLSGTNSMAARAKSHGADLIIVDTSGVVSGTAFQRLKSAKIDLLVPVHIVAIERHAECEHILRPLKHHAGISIHRLTPATAITTKSGVLRQQRRTMKFSKAFRDAITHTFDWDRTPFLSTWLGTGEPLPPHELQFLSKALGTKCLHAEKTPKHLGIVSTTEVQHEKGWVEVQEQFRMRNITLSPITRYEHLLVGLSDVNGHCLGIGSIEKIDFRSRILEVITHVTPAMAIANIHFGLIRVRPDGMQLGVNPTSSV